MIDERLLPYEQLNAFLNEMAKKYAEYVNKEFKRMKDSGHYGSEPQRLFPFTFYCQDDINYIDFDTNNWNGVDIVRRYLYNNNIDIYEDIDVKLYIYDGQTYYFIFTEYDFYEISWYKQRGKTDYIKKNGQLISLSEYLLLFMKLAYKSEMWKEIFNEL